MGKFINQHEAKLYWDKIPDPVIQSLIQQAYGKIFTGEAMEFQGEFDVLFFFKIMERFFCDRHRLGKMLTGETTGHSWVAD